MAAIVVAKFGGIQPLVADKMLPDNAAVTAQNCDLRGGALRGLNGNTTTGNTISSSDVVIFYDALGSGWIGNTTDRDFVRVPIANDSLHRWAGTALTGSYPLIASSATSYRLGIPAPSTQITIGAYTGVGDANALDAETISYVMTFVDAWGSEGPPNVPSESIDHTINTDVALTLPAMPAGAYNLGSGALKRIYRSNTGTDGTQYQFVKEVAYNVTSTTDDVDNEDLGEVIPSTSWIGPPDDNTSLYPNGPITGMCSLPNGVLAAFAYTELCFSEPFLYHAWPSEYRITFDETIVGMCPLSAGLFVVTTKRPYLVTGVHPSAMSVTAYDCNLGCASKRSVVDMGDYAIYSSYSGLVIADATSAKLVELTTKEQWAASFAPSTTTAHRAGGKYVAAMTTTTGYVFDPRGGANALVTTDYGFKAIHLSTYSAAVTDTPYVLDSGTIYQWGTNTASPKTYTWKSKIFTVDQPINFGVARIETTTALASSNVTLRIWADGSEITGSPFTLNGTDSFIRLPGGFRSRNWQFQLSGTNEVTRFGLYESMAEMV